MFDKWHVAFYGTPIGRLRRMLDLGDIPLQGKQHCSTNYNFIVWTNVGFTDTCLIFVSL